MIVSRNQRMVPVEKARVLCPVCGKADFCLVDRDGGKCICMRTADSGKLVDMGTLGEGWLHVLDGSLQAAQDRPQVPSRPRPEPADRDTLHRAYSAILGALALSDEHRQGLHGRGLTDEHLELAGYRTMPERGRARLARVVVEALGGDLEAALRVPGIYIRHDGQDSWPTLAGDQGTIIPGRDLAGRVCNLLIRRDGDLRPRYRLLTSRGDSRGNGPGPRPLAHVPAMPARRDQVRLTEGPLKADTAQALSGILTLGLPGVSSWRLALPVLEELRPALVLVSFDSDFREKPQVARSLVELVETLATWRPR